MRTNHVGSVVAICLAGVLLSGVAVGTTVNLPKVTAPPSLEEFAAAMQGGFEPDTDLAAVDGFKTRYPNDGEPVSERTIVYLGHDESNIFAVFMCYDTESNRIQARRAPRDRLADDDDAVAIYLDTYRDQRRAYGFQANAAGALLDATWIEGKGWVVDPDWDWSANGARTERGYVVQFTIPLQSLSAAAFDRSWGLMLFRGIPRRNETAYWPQYSQAVAGRMTQAAELQGLEGFGNSSRLKVSPYAAVRHVTMEDRQSTAGQAGVDVQFRWNDALQLAISLNPDFAQIEADEPQIAVNRRFELFFPEKRPLLSDSARFFQQPIEVFFSRRIEALQAGAFSSGKIGTISYAGLYARDELEDGLADIIALRGQVEAAAGHTLGVIGTARDAADASNRLSGLDGHLQIGDAWVADFQAANTWIEDAETSEEGLATYAHVGGTDEKWSYDLSYRYIEQDFRPALGFVPRTGIQSMNQNAGWRSYPADRWVLSWGPIIELEYVSDEQGHKLDWGQKVTLSLEAPNLTFLSVFATHKSERLTPTDFPVLSEDVTLNTQQWGFSAASNLTSIVSGSLLATWGSIGNFVPRAGMPPDEADLFNFELKSTLRLGSLTTVDLTALYTQLDSRADGARLFDNLVARAKLTLNWTNAWSTRLTLSHERLDTVAGRTTLQPLQSLNVDLLLAWQRNAGQAWYLGVNHDLDRSAPIGFGNDPLSAERLGPWSTRSRLLQTKFTYSF